MQAHVTVIIAVSCLPFFRHVFPLLHQAHSYVCVSACSCLSVPEYRHACPFANAVSIATCRWPPGDPNLGLRFNSSSHHLWLYYCSPSGCYPILLDRFSCACYWLLVEWSIPCNSVDHDWLVAIMYLRTEGATLVVSNDSGNCATIGLS